jgi:hypothetical protein
VLLKEPTALRKWTSSLAALAASQGHEGVPEVLFKSLRAVVEHVDGAPQWVELKQISRQGTPGFLGASVCCQALGMIEEVQEPAEKAWARKHPEKAMAASQG